MLFITIPKFKYLQRVLKEKILQLMKVSPPKILDVLLIEPKVFGCGDRRFFF